MDQLQLEGDGNVVTDLTWLARGPSGFAVKCKRFVINGFRFRTKDIDNEKNTQNCGVRVTATTTNDANVTYYGKLVDIIELDYSGPRKVVLFECEWVNDRGVKQDELGFTLVNFGRRLITEEPYVLASQALQVFYAKDLVEKGWHVAINIMPRDLFNMGEMHVDDGETYLEGDVQISDHVDVTGIDVDNVDEVRANVPPIPVNDEHEIGGDQGYESDIEHEDHDFMFED